MYRLDYYVNKIPQKKTHFTCLVYMFEQKKVIQVKNYTRNDRFFGKQEKIKHLEACFKAEVYISIIINRT